mgnify:CR=1 FL=1
MLKKMKKKNKGSIKTSEVAKELGAMWKKLSDKDKTPYVKLAEKDRERYMYDNMSENLAYIEARKDIKDKVKSNKNSIDLLKDQISIKFLLKNNFLLV